LAVYSIKDLEKLSGIKAHTIRIWEKRYDLLTPHRTKTNIRYYLDDDLKCILNVAMLNRHGIRISRIAEMKPEERKDAVMKLSVEQDNHEIQADALTLALIEMDERKFDAIIRKKTREIGFKKTMLEVIFPFLSKLDLLWLTGSVSPVQESFITGLVKQKIYVELDQIPLPSNKSVKFLLYLPDGESHELSMLFLHFLLRSACFQVINIGPNIRLIDLKKACQIHHPDYILTMINEGIPQKSTRDYIEELSLHCRQCQLLITGRQVTQHQVKSKKNYTVFQSLDDIIHFSESLDLIRH